MPPPKGQGDHDDCPLDECRLDVERSLGGVRERLARLESTIDNHEQTLAERHGQVMEAIDELRERQDQVDGRTWKLSMVLAVLGVGGGAGAMELLRGVLGG